MFDEKLDNARTGKEGTGSNSICMLCHCTRILARKTLGQWSITKTIKEIIDLAFKRIENPDGLTESHTSSAASSMEDVLKICWLVISKKLQRITKTSTRPYCCSNCGDNGHSVRTSPALNNAHLDEILGEMHTLEIHN